MKSYITALLTNYLGLILTMAIQIFLLPFLLNRIGLRLTGMYYLFITISNFAAVGIGWLSGAGVYLLASAEGKGNADLNEIHWATFLGFCVYATALLIIILLWGATAGSLWMYDDTPELVKQVRYACVFLGVFIWVHYVHQADVSLFTAILQQGWANFYRIVNQIVFLILVLTIVISNPRIDLLMLANMIGVIAAAVSARIHLRIAGRLRPMRLYLPDKELIRKIFLTSGGPYFIFGIARITLIYIDVLLIGAVLGPAMVSAYLIIWRIPEVAALLLGRISEILNPYLTYIHTRNGLKNTTIVFLCTSRLQHCLGIISGIAYAVFGSEMVGYWVGTAHRPTSLWIYWIAGAALFIHVVNLHDIILHYALASLRHLIYVHYTELILRIVLTLAFFQIIGASAPIAAVLMIHLPVLTWIYRASALRQISIKWRQWLSSVGIWAGIALITAGCSAILIRRLIPETGIFNFILSISVYSFIALLIIAIIEWYHHETGIFYLNRLMSKA